MPAQAATTAAGRAAVSQRKHTLSDRLHLEDIELPGRVIDVEAGIDDLATVALIDLSPHQIGQAYSLAGKLDERHRQSALSLIAGIIDDNEMAGATVAGPGVSNEVVRGPVAGPRRLRLDLRAGAVAQGRCLP